MPLALVAGCGSVGPTTRAAAAQAETAVQHRLAGDHLLQIDGRQHRVVGSNDVVRADGSRQTVLLVIDERSGQMRYSRPGLLFSLRPSVDAVSFLRDYPALRALFVNPQQVQVAVDPDRIAAQFAALRADPRVDRLGLLPLEAVAVPRSADDRSGPR